MPVKISYFTNDFPHSLSIKNAVYLYLPMSILQGRKTSILILFKNKKLKYLAYDIIN